MKPKLAWSKLLTTLSFVMIALSVLAFGRIRVQAATAPTGLRQTQASTSSVTVAWNAVFGGSNKVWTKISDNASMSPCTFDYTYNTSDYFYGLNPGQTYYVQIGMSDTSKLSSTPPEDTVWSAPVPVVTAPDSVPSETIKFTKATTNSLTFTWQAAAGATSYNVSYHLSTASSDTSSVVSTETNSITISGLQSDTEYDINIAPVRTEPSTGFAATDNSTSRWNYPTLPKNVSGLEVTAFSINGSLHFEWNKCKVADGYEAEVYTYNGKKPLIKQSLTSSYLYLTNKKLKTAQIYKFRVRAYVTNADNNKSYSSWSAYQYTSRILDKATVKKSGSKLKVSWKKVKGASSYTVYMATDSSTHTYKKMGTTNKTNLLLKKKIKKGTYYYIRIVPNYKKGKKTYPGYSSKSSYTVQVWYSASGKLYV